MRVLKAAVSTSDVTPKTAARRTRALKRVRNVVSCGDVHKQRRLEVKALPCEEREKLLHSAGLNVDVPEGQGLALRCDIDLPWNKLRVLKK